MVRIERWPVYLGNDTCNRLYELYSIIESWQPQRAVSWVQDYFNNVTVIYAFELFYVNRIYPPNYSIEDSLADFELIDTVLKAVWKQAGGIMKHDGDGITNEEGKLVLMDPAHNSRFDKECAVLGNDGEWRPLDVDFSDAAQVAAFLNGA
jgi:hypothetical protein